MAKILKDFPSYCRRNDIYPWDEWADGKVRELCRGEDFQCSSRSLRHYAYRRAAERNTNLRSRVFVRDGKEIVVLQFVDKPKGQTRG